MHKPPDFATAEAARTDPGDVPAVPSGVTAISHPGGPDTPEEWEEMKRWVSGWDRTERLGGLRGGNGRAFCGLSEDEDRVWNRAAARSF